MLVDCQCALCSYNPAADASNQTAGLGLDLDSIQQLSSQVVDQDELQVRLYSGRIVRGALSGARIILKAYPPPALAASIAAASSAATPPLDVAGLADNEVRAQLRLQEPAVSAESDNLAKLLGTLTVESGAAKGERWLLFHNAGATSAAEYAQRAAQATVDGTAVGEGEFWDKFDSAGPLKRRKIFLVKVRCRPSPPAAPTAATRRPRLSPPQPLRRTAAPPHLSSVQPSLHSPRTMHCMLCPCARSPSRKRGCGTASCTLMHAIRPACVYRQHMGLWSRFSGDFNVRCGYG